MDKIVCVGKNYAAHVLEMGGNVSEKPVLFIKPPSVLRQVENSEIASVALPKNRGAVHYETEIVLMLGEKNQIKAVTLGLDMTLRDQQANLKKAGQPWEIAKVFSNSAIVGPFIPIEEFADFATSEFQMKLDGVPRQKAQSTQMTLSPL
ncbi:MAG TPA: fumarylacetoacetate hydrolase family protein, partial [Oligoflexia bacterium]|nr:fumarylacetoacetate hydrolase family protein [Oligoflexia bacterium]